MKEMSEDLNFDIECHVMMDNNPYLAHLKEPAGPGPSRKKRRSLQLSKEPDGIMSSSERYPKRQRRPASPGESGPGPRPNLGYGNYPAYYGYRQAHGDRVDSRLFYLKQEWFQGKTILDIGCNAGLLTLDVAMLFEPATITGIDIDPSLIRKAKKTLKYRGSLVHPKLGTEDRLEYFPQSCLEVFGPVPRIVSDTGQASSLFPNNVYFQVGDWLSKELLSQEKFDVILALSVTKWIHLNHGDSGIKRFFQKCFSQLSPGGHFILEPQPFSSYSKKAAKGSMQENLKNIKLLPDEGFKELLLSPSVGFKDCVLLGQSHNSSKGFQRPLYMFTK
jgi:7SK snRNA methylphosphate capping enzyme